MLVNIIQNTISSFRSALAAAEVITTNLKMWLGFETSSIDGDKQITPDKSGNNNVGELFTGKALEFDGSTTYVSANSFAGTLSNNTAFTFAIWFNSDKIPTDYFRNILISSGGPQQFTNIFKIGVNPQTSATGSANVGGIYFDDSAGGYNNVVPSSGGVNYNDGEWHRLVVSRPQGSGNQTLTFYVDGSSIGTAPCNPYWNNVNLFDFGQEWDGAGTSDHFGGMMSNIQVYDYAWTTDDVTFDYANPQNLVTDRSGTSIGLSNLKGYWHLSEGAGTVAYDSSGEGNNGTINGATYEPAQPRIPQLGMMNWAKSTPVADEITLIPNPNNTTEDILRNAVRDRLNSFNLDGSGYAANESLPTISGNISLSFWVKLDTFVSGNLGQVVGRRSASDSNWLRVYRPFSSNLKLEISAAATDSTTFNVTENQWVYVAITINSSDQASIYVDNLAASTVTFNSSFVFSNTIPFTVGAWLNPALQPTSKLNGLVSDVLIYDRVLTSDEVENNYNAGLSAHTN